MKDCRPIRATSSKSPASAIEIWGGVECTHNRVGDRYLDQLESTGHDRRDDDISAIASLGVRTVRYPVLWERVAPDGLETADWSWTDRRLAALRAHGVEPIVGLVHHGSGPRSTDLLDAGFVDGLARFAGAVAERYPWLRFFTPVNEPLTTARFAGLYGLWYPHARDDRSFVRILLNECRAVAASMRAVRRHIPDARLVQTEDIARTHGRSTLRHQIDFENERRWLSFDVLFGRVGARHPLRGYLERSGLTPAELAPLGDDAVPDLVGLNYYVTSERFLDERVELYPPPCRGGNGSDRYADVEAVRVDGVRMHGVERLVSDAYARYGHPVAITECHIGCSREEQLRWFSDVLQDARRARASGVDLRAVTAWSLFGATDWDSLVTAARGHYESGAFDARGGSARPTALAQAVAQAAAGDIPSHPVLQTAGWWRRPERLAYGSAEDGGIACRDRRKSARRVVAQPLLVVGARGTLGAAFMRIATARGLAARGASRGDLDISDAASVRAFLGRVRPWAVINAAGYVRVDDAQDDRDACFAANVRGAAALASGCAELALPYATFSSDLVFGGDKCTPYLEGDAAGPVNVYGESKHAAEHAVRAAHPRALIIRTSAFFGPWDTANFASAALAAAGLRAPFPAAGQVVVSPTYVPDLVHACLDLVIDGAAGTWHLANAGALSWADFATLVVERAGLRPMTTPTEDMAALGWRARRPVYSALGSTNGVLLPPLDDAVDRFVRDRVSSEALLAG